MKKVITTLTLAASIALTSVPAASAGSSIGGGGGFSGGGAGGSWDKTCIL